SIRSSRCLPSWKPPRRPIAAGPRYVGWRAHELSSTARGPDLSHARRDRAHPGLAVAFLCGFRVRHGPNDRTGPHPWTGTALRPIEGSSQESSTDSDQTLAYRVRVLASLKPTIT